MKLKLVSHAFTGNSTISDIFIDGIYECKILEPAWRGNDNKNHVEFKTASPEGMYNVIINHSPRFNRDMPLIQAVEDFDFGNLEYNSCGVRIHWGNYPKDTEACLLTGTTEGADFVGHSVGEFNILFAKFQKAIANGETITLEIDRSQKPIA